MVGTTTSSPRSKPAASRARWSAAVAELRAIAFRTPMRSAKRPSKAATRLPVVSHPERSTSVTASMSWSSISGCANGNGARRGARTIARVVAKCCSHAFDAKSVDSLSNTVTGADGGDPGVEAFWADDGSDALAGAVIVPGFTTGSIVTLQGHDDFHVGFVSARSDVSNVLSFSL